MNDYREDIDNQEELAEPEELKESSLALLLRYAELDNIADELDGEQLTKIGRQVCEGYKTDEASRSEWLKKSKKAMDLALQVQKKKTFPWPDAANVKYPLVTVAALQFHARAYPAIVQGNKVVKGQITGEDQDGAKVERAERISAHMNYQLLEEMAEWDEQQDKMLLALPIEGSQFKKSYFDPSKGRNVSEWVRPVDFVVNNSTKSLEDCPRATHVLHFYPQQIIEKQRLGVFRNVELNISADDEEDEKPQKFLEQHCLWDLDDDGYKEPYCVTVHEDSQEVVRIKARYYPENVIIKAGGAIVSLGELLQQGIDPSQLMQLPEVEIAKIEPVNYFTKFPFIPSPDGSFYDIGFGQLIGPLSEVIDTNINQLLDAGTASNLQAGFLSDGVNINNGKRGPVRFDLGEFKPVKVPAGMSLRDAIYQLQFPGPSPVLFSLLGTLIDSAKEITSVQDIMTGDAPANETATTTLARIEQGMKVFTAIYKRIYRSLKQEFKKLYRLNSIYLQPQSYFNVLDTNEPAQILQQDYQGDGTDVQPVADPTIATTMQKVAKAQALLQMLGDPRINADEVLLRFLDAIEVPNPQALLIPPEQRQPPPDPKMMEMEIKAAQAQAQAEKVRAEIVGIHANAMKALAEAEAKEAGVQIDQYRAQLEALKTEMEALSGAVEPGGAGAVEVPAADQAGLPAAAAGQAELLGPLGAGPDTFQQPL